jgi:hypothetical protein
MVAASLTIRCSQSCILRLVAHFVVAPAQNVSGVLPEEDPLGVETSRSDMMC